MHSKYIALFDYFDKSLIVLSVTSGSISIASFTTVIGAPVGIASAIFSLAFSIFTSIVKKLLKKTRNKKKKHNKTVMLARNKLNSIAGKISEALINNEISHGDLLLVKTKNYRDLKKGLEWWKLKKMILIEIIWLKNLKKRHW